MTASATHTFLWSWKPICAIHRCGRVAEMTKMVAVKVYEEGFFEICSQVYSLLS